MKCNYVVPQTEVIELVLEGVLCQSSDDIEDYRSGVND